jgi:hypothetical protein
VQPETFTTPPVAVSPEHEASVPPDEVSVIVDEDEVTRLPKTSSISTTGCVVNAAPESPATGCVVKINFVAGPDPEGEKLLLVAEVSEPLVAVRV